MCKLLLTQIIQFYATQFGIDPNVAVAVAEAESSMRIHAIGSVGEVGLFQIRPEYSSLNKDELKNPVNNIIKGVLKLRQAKEECIHKQDLTWLTCYNRGISGAKKVKNPHKDQYVLKVKNKIKNKKDYTCE